MHPLYPIPHARLLILIYCSFDFFWAVMFRQSGNKPKKVDRSGHASFLAQVPICWISLSYSQSTLAKKWQIQSRFGVADLEYDLPPKFSRGNSWIAPTLNLRDCYSEWIIPKFSNAPDFIFICRRCLDKMLSESYSCITDKIKQL